MKTLKTKCPGCTEKIIVKPGLSLILRNRITGQYGKTIHSVECALNALKKNEEVTTVIITPELINWIKSQVKKYDSRRRVNLRMKVVS